LGRPNQLEEAREITPQAINSALKALASMSPFVVVDLPRSFSFTSSVALADADHVLIVTQLGVPFIRNATRIYDCLLQMGTEERCIEIVLNRCNANFERITPDEVAAHFGQPVFAMIPNDYRRVQSSLDLGRPIGTDAPTSPARVAIQEMAQKLASDKPHDEQTRPASSGFLGKLWRRSSKV
jgi:pilus assembly protein CpaE